METGSSLAEYARELRSPCYQEEQDTIIAMHEQGQCRNISCWVSINCPLIDPPTVALHSEHSKPNVTPQTCSDSATEIYPLRRRVDWRVKKETFISNMLTESRDPSSKTMQCKCMQVYEACLEADLQPCFHVREPKHWQELAKWRMLGTTCSQHSRANQRENVIRMQVPRASILLVEFAFLTMMISIKAKLSTSFSCNVIRYEIQKVRFSRSKSQDGNKSGDQIIRSLSMLHVRVCHDVGCESEMLLEKLGRD
jgi:hypothetical protein